MVDYIERIRLFMDKNADLPYPDETEDVIVFGSYVNTNKDKIHDIDTFIRLDEKREEWGDFTKLYFPNATATGIDYLFLAYENELRYLRNKSKIISLHGEVDFEAAIRDKHIYLVRDGVMQEDVISELLDI